MFDVDLSTLGQIQKLDFFFILWSLFLYCYRAMSSSPRIKCFFTEGPVVLPGLGRWSADLWTTSVCGEPTLLTCGSRLEQATGTSIRIFAYVQENWNANNFSICCGNFLFYVWFSLLWVWWWVVCVRHSDHILGQDMQQEQKGTKKIEMNTTQYSRN